MTPREIDTILGVLRDHKAQLTRIEEHAEKTNGRVTTLELWKARMDGAKWALSWVPGLVIAVTAGATGAVLAATLT